MINNQSQTQGQDVANGLIYSLICGGILGLLGYILIIVNNTTLLLKTILSKNFLQFREDPIFLGSLFCSCYLIGRTIFENGFASYGVDFLIFVPCFAYIHLQFKNLKKTF